MTVDVHSVSVALQGSMSPNASEIKASEAHLSQAENQAAGPLLSVLLGIVFGETQQLAIRQSAAIYAKNLLKRRWTEDGAGLGSAPLSESDKTQIRALLVDATCGAKAVALPRQIQSQVNAIISYIAGIDFPLIWPTLLPALVETLNSGSTTSEVRLNALNCVCSVFRKYKTVSRSNTVLGELKYLLPLFQETHLRLFSSVLPAVLAGDNQLLGALDQLLEIFYSLNVVDIPEFYQDHTGAWMKGFLQLLALPSVDLKQDEPGPLDVTKALVCDNLALYADKYQEVFEPFVGEGVKSVWTLLVGVADVSKNSSQFDQMIAAGIGFLSSAANTKWSHSPFDESEALAQICEKLVLPNIQLRDADVELFVDNPDEYIRRDLQAADSDTRRRSAVDLVKSLSRFYEEKVTEILLAYISNLLQNFASNTRAKDACIQLVTAIACKGETRAQGVSIVNPKVDINRFFETQLTSVLSAVATTDDTAVLQASALKFLILFRSQLQSDLVAAALPAVLALIVPTSQRVVQCYAAHCGFLLIQLCGLGASSRRPVVENILRIIVGSSIEEGQNEFLMKLFFKLVDGDVYDENFSLLLLRKQMELVVNFSSNPVNAVFTHYLFESVGAVAAATVRHHHQAKARDVLVGPLCMLLEKNVTEYIPYALQILALLVESAETKVDVFGHLLNLLLNEELWKNVSLIPGLARILSAYLNRSGDLYGPAIQPNLKPIGSRIAMLINTVKFEPIGFDLLAAVWARAALPTDVMQTILVAILTKIHHKKTEKLIRQFAVALCVLASSNTAAISQLVAVLDSHIQAGLSTQVIKDLWMHAVAQLNLTSLNPKTKKVVCLGLAHLIVNQQSNPVALSAILAAVQAMVCAPAVIVPTEEIKHAPIDESGSFEVSYAKLSSTVNPVYDNDFVPHIVSADPLGTLKATIKTLPHEILHTVPQLSHWANLA